MKQLSPYLVLIRPPNLITSAADVIAGFAISGSIVHFSVANGMNIAISEPLNVLLLILSSICIYGGGITLNDVYDAFTDAIERPERPIPSRAISRKHAMIYGYALFLAGIISALFVSMISALAACFIAGCALLYDLKAKHHLVFGPITMGLCRAGNLILGMTAVADIFMQEYPLAVIPLVYIASVTLIARGEVSGGRRSWLITGGAGYLVTILALLLLSINETGLIGLSTLIIGLLAINVLPPLAAAVVSKDASKIGPTVKKGVLSIILIDAFFVSIYAGTALSVLTLLLYPLTLLTAKYFSVT